MEPDNSPESATPVATHPTAIPQEQIQRQTDDLPTSTPVEMSSLPNQSSSSTEQHQSEAAAASHPLSQDHEELAANGPQPDSTVPSEPEPTAPHIVDSSPAAIATAVQSPDVPAIGPNTDGPIVALDSASGPTVRVTLLLISGARHRFDITERYLRKRNVMAEDDVIDPFSITVYKMKELIWRDWREEWEPKPPSYSSIRLIYFGKLLDDNLPLREYFKNVTASNVVHMNVKPQDLGEDDDHAKSSHVPPRDEEESSAGCCRCVIL